MKHQSLLKLMAGHGKCPAAGSGVHQFLIEIALRLVNRINRQNLFEYMEYATAGCGRDVPDDEIWGVIEWASHVFGGEPRHTCSEQRERPVRVGKFELDRELIASICSRNLSFLGEIPPPLSPAEYPFDLAEQVFQTLFERKSPNPLVTFAERIERFRVARLTEARHFFLHRSQFILPNPVIGASGKTADGLRDSPRATSNVLGWKNFVVEFDDTRLHDQLRLIEYLAEHAPLLLVVFSENKSFHSWFDVAGFSESERIDFQRLACRLGADPALCKLSQPTRVPLGIRVSKDGVRSESRHRVVYVNQNQL